MAETTERTEPRPLLVLLFGGRSGEHQISCATAGGVLRAIDDSSWDVWAVGISPEGEWIPLPSEPEEYDLRDDSGYTVTPNHRRVAFLPGSPRLIEYEVDEARNPVGESVSVIGDVDVVFPLLHGPYGEDGTVQGLLEFSGVKYVGCGVASSAVCQDKHLTKVVLKDAGIDVGEWVAFTRDEWDRDALRIKEDIAALGLPVFVKPCRAGSSLGVTRVDNDYELDAAIKDAQQHDPRVIVERAARGREVECGVLSTVDGEVHASAIGEINVLGDTFYDYKTKYFNPDGVDLQCPADLPDGVGERIREIAVRAFEATAGEGISRVDFFYDPQTDNITLNEINTMPGFTPFSMYPTMFRESGLSYAELVAALLEEAIARPNGLR